VWVWPVSCVVSCAERQPETLSDIAWRFLDEYMPSVPPTRSRPAIHHHDYPQCARNPGAGTCAREPQTAPCGYSDTGVWQRVHRPHSRTGTGSGSPMRAVKPDATSATPRARQPSRPQPAQPAHALRPNGGRQRLLSAEPLRNAATHGLSKPLMAIHQHSTWSEQGRIEAL